MNGQWIGPYSGSNSGLLVLELDDLGSGYEGDVYAYNSVPTFPAMIGDVRIPKGKLPGKFSIQLEPLDKENGIRIDRSSITARFPGVTVPTTADVDLSISGNNMTLTWTTDIGTSGRGVVVASSAAEPTNLSADPSVKTWEEFKQYAVHLPFDRYLFRGHESNKWRLRSSFHRTGRASLVRFMNQDINVLHRNLSGLTLHQFRLDNSHDYAAFLNLIQHHGYPTPLLDWTRSPFVAVYFAFKKIDVKKVRPDDKARILVLNAMEYRSTYKNASVLAPAYLHISLLEPLAINNPRVVPQQSATSVSNVDDLELFFAEKEKATGKKFLTAVDLPASDRNTIMRELELMGITAGSLFPGLDGACEQLRERFFRTP